MTQLIDIAEIVGDLTERMPALAAELMPLGHRMGREWVDAHRAQGGLGDSLSVNLQTGIWKHFNGSARGGDALDLIAYLKFAGDKRRAVTWARAWLGIDPVDPGAFAVKRAVVQKTTERAQRDEERRRGSALRLFLGSREPLAGTDAAAYLTSRGIDLAQLGRQPRALRFHPGLVHPETGEIAPALVAGISAPDGRIVAVSQLFLERHAGGVRALSSVADPAVTLGHYRGGAIRISRGASGKRLNDAAPGEWVAVAVALEDTLAVALAAPEMRVLSAVSFVNLRTLRLPRAIAGVTIVAPNDPPGSPAEAELHRAVQHFHAQGFRVRIGRPPPGCMTIGDLLPRQVRDGSGAA